MPEDAYRIREATLNDAEGVAALFAADGNPHCWSAEKYLHYYRDYPEGRPFALVAVSDEGEMVGFYALLPVQISDLPCFMQLHVFVREDYRRYPIAKTFLEKGCDYANGKGAAMIIAFSNYKFSQVLRRLFGWHLLGYLEFADVSEVDPECYRDRLHFEYSDDWFHWKFGNDLKDAYVQTYNKDGKSVCQLLKARNNQKANASQFEVVSLNAWHPDGYRECDQGTWSQTVTIKALRQELVDYIYDLRNWYIEMGDSDTFEFDLTQRLKYQSPIAN